MTRNQIKDYVFEIIAKHLGIRINQISENSTLYDLGADSLDIIELIMALEDTFDIELLDKILQKLNTIKDLINYIVQLNPTIKQYAIFKIQLDKIKKKPAIYKKQRIGELRR